MFPIAIYPSTQEFMKVIPAIVLRQCTIIESVDSISRDERDAPLTQYITNAGITHTRYTITHFKHHHRVLWLITRSHIKKAQLPTTVVSERDVG